MHFPINIGTKITHEPTKPIVDPCNMKPPLTMEPILQMHHLQNSLPVKKNIEPETVGYLDGSWNYEKSVPRKTG